MKFRVLRFYSGYCQDIIEAENDEDAFNKVKDLPINEKEILNTLSTLKESDVLVRYYHPAICGNTTATPIEGE